MYYPPLDVHFVPLGWAGCGCNVQAGLLDCPGQAGPCRAFPQVQVHGSLSGRSGGECLWPGPGVCGWAGPTPQLSDRLKLTHSAVDTHRHTNSSVSGNSG